MANRLTYLVGVTSAPRPKPTLSATLDSLAAAGWTEPIVFYDAERRGPWWNFKRTLTSLLCIGGSTHLSSPPDMLLIVEDDIEVTPGLRWWIDENRERIPPHCLISLYWAMKRPHSHKHGFHFVDDHGRLVNGALAYLIPFARAATLDSAIVIDPMPGRTETDIQIANACSRINNPAYVAHYPSFVRHTGGGNSSLRVPCGNDENRQCTEFVTRINQDGSFSTDRTCIQSGG